MKYPEMLSFEAPPSEVAYSARDTILYALGVGAGAETMDDGDLAFVYEKGLLALPTMATNLLGKDGGLLQKAGVDLKMMLHSEQRLRIHKPLPPEGRLIAKSRIAHVADKGKDKGAVVNNEYTLTCAESGALHATVILTLYCRGDGGFGGPAEDMFPLHRLPDRAADAELALRTASNQAALYRLSIGDTNPLHIDPEFAAKIGFERPILHGMCTFGFAGRAVMKRYCGNDPARLRSFDARFAAPFYPGETLATRMWEDGAAVSFECLSAERGVTVLRNGRCEIA